MRENREIRWAPGGKVKPPGREDKAKAATPR